MTWPISRRFSLPTEASLSAASVLSSLRSIKSTFPDLINFRVARLNGFRRVFAHVAPIFFEHEIANPETREISSLSVEPCEGETLIVTVFEIQKSEISAFMERELEFHFLAVLPETLHGEPFGHPAVSVLGIVMKNFSKSDGKVTFNKIPIGHCQYPRLQGKG
ncbi:hypothetical protein SLEP1_g40113 [Rubroshorea leprosula]|uniref:Uncharacterized protein n=1 Tax=Rubroshorea leprosula TaxID=152421 RepID=A0AAV5L312_9ROSI|nr:hypothetical protein SLEP1_g40113 [Rubroshorea leprosula]